MTSRKHLYAMGEPIGDGATRRKLGGGLILGDGGEGGSSSSSTASSMSTTNKDQRLVADGGSIGLSGDNSRINSTSTSTTNLQVVDTGTVQAGRDIALASLASNNTNTDHLFAAADTLFGQIGKNLSHAADLTATLQQGSNDALKANIGLTSLLANNAQSDLSKGYDLASKLASGAASAYSDATAQATGNKSLIMVAIVVCGLAAVLVLGKK